MRCAQTRDNFNIQGSCRVWVRSKPVVEKEEKTAKLLNIMHRLAWPTGIWGSPRLRVSSPQPPIFPHGNFIQYEESSESLEEGVESRERDSSLAVLRSQNAAGRRGLIFLRTFNSEMS